MSPGLRHACGTEESERARRILVRVSSICGSSGVGAGAAETCKSPRSLQKPFKMFQNISRSYTSLANRMGYPGCSIPVGRVVFRQTLNCHRIAVGRQGLWWGSSRVRVFPEGNQVIGLLSWRFWDDHQPRGAIKQPRLQTDEASSRGTNPRQCDARNLS